MPSQEVLDAYYAAFQFQERPVMNTAPGEEITEVMEIMDRYYAAIEDGTIGTFLPAQDHVWRHYQGVMTVERIRERFQAIDDYMGHMSQKGYVERETGQTYDAGPELLRMPDGALLAMFQELDAVYAKYPPPVDDYYIRYGA